jgi:hypothetical protein
MGEERAGALGALKRERRPGQRAALRKTPSIGSAARPRTQGISSPHGGGHSSRDGLARAAAAAMSRHRKTAELIEIRERLADQGARPQIVKCALTFADIERYELPADFTKASDTRSAAFVAKWGDVLVELDALPIDVLRKRIVTEIECRMDLAALQRVKAVQEEQRQRLVQALGAIGGAR